MATSPYRSDSNMSTSSTHVRVARGVPLGVILVGVLVVQALAIFIAMKFVTLF